MPSFAIIEAASDDDFTEKLYAIADRVQPGLTLIGTGAVGPVLVRDAQQALTESGGVLAWLAVVGEPAVEAQLGLPDGITEEQLENVYAAIEAGFPHLMNGEVQLQVAALPQVLAASGR